jgi:biopolymer transport protein ExbD
MAGADVGADRGAKQKGKKIKKKRIAIRIDMTPMVDVAFLLLTFFMLTTYFSKPQAMEINLPPDVNVNVEVAESNLLTLRIMKDGTIFWNMGLEKPSRMTTKDLPMFLTDKIRANPRLVTLVKIEREGTFSQLVDVIDELNIAKITRFSIAPFGDIDKKIVTKAGA